MQTRQILGLDFACSSQAQIPCVYELRDDGFIGVTRGGDLALQYLSESAFTMVVSVLHVYFIIHTLE